MYSSISALLNLYFICSSLYWALAVWQVHSQVLHFQSLIRQCPFLRDKCYNMLKFALRTERRVLYEIGDGRQMSSRRLPAKYT